MQHRCSCGRVTDYGTKCTNCSRDICLSEEEVDVNIEDLLEEEDKGDDDEES